MSKIVTLIDGKTGDTNFPRTVISAITNDDGTPFSATNTEETDAITSNIGSLGLLNTTEKTNIVASINEIDGSLKTTNDNLSAINPSEGVINYSSEAYIKYDAGTKSFNFIFN